MPVISVTTSEQTETDRTREQIWLLLPFRQSNRLPPRSLGCSAFHAVPASDGSPHSPNCHTFKEGEIASASQADSGRLAKRQTPGYRRGLKL